MLAFVALIALVLCVGCDGSIGRTTSRLKVELMPNNTSFSQSPATADGIALAQAEFNRAFDQFNADIAAINAWYDTVRASATTQEERDAIEVEKNQRSATASATFTHDSQNANHVVWPVKGAWSKLNVPIKITAYSDTPSLPAKLTIDVVYYDDTTATLYGYTDLLAPGEYYETVEFGTMDYVKGISNLRIL